jgi:hypothetical protein
LQIPLTLSTLFIYVGQFKGDAHEILYPLVNLWGSAESNRLTCSSPIASLFSRTDWILSNFKVRANALALTHYMNITKKTFPKSSAYSHEPAE